MEFQFNIRSEFMLIVAVAGLMALVACLTLGCRDTSNEALTGTYVNTAGSEYSIANDTLIVELSQGNAFLIHRRTGFQLLNAAGKPGKVQHETEEWSAVYDPAAQVMTEKRNGKTITFNANRSIMTVAKRKYERIN